MHGPNCPVLFSFFLLQIVSHIMSSKRLPKTHAELIRQRADATQPNMGLTSWEKSPEGKILKSDVSIAKNYLTKEELQSLGRIVNACLDAATGKQTELLNAIMAQI
jgi:hypothetical protein